METRCYIAIFVFAALSTVLGYLIFKRHKVLFKLAADAPVTAASPLVPARKAT